MPLNNSLSSAYSAAVATAGATARSFAPVFAQTTANAGAPSQVAFIGPVSPKLSLVQPIIVEFEYDEGGKIIASDDIFFMYGAGATREQAALDYFSSLTEYYELLDSQEDESSVALLRFLQAYLQRI